MAEEAKSVDLKKNRENFKCNIIFYRKVKFQFIRKRLS